ncbi:hypothetical protein GC194_13740 [bacterium]|nr:hypothetical protein [bacterium]
MKYKLPILLAAGLLFYACSPKLLPFKEHGKYGYEKKDGTQAIAPQFDDAAAFHEGFAKVAISVSKTDSIWHEPMFGADGYYSVEKYEVLRYTFVDTKGQVFDLKLNDAKQFSNGLAPALLKGKWGYINKNGEWQIPPQYADASLFEKGKAQVITESNSGKTWYYKTIDRNNKVLVDDTKGQRKPDWFDSIPDWHTLLASANIYVRLTDYQSAFEYYQATARRIDQIEHEDTLAYMDLCQQLAYFGAMRVDEKVYDTYDKLAREKIDEVLRTDIPRRRMILLNYIDYLIRLSQLRENNLQKDKEKETLQRVLDMVKRAGEDVSLYWDIEERLNAFDE